MTRLIQSLLSHVRGWALALVLATMLALPSLSFALDRLVLKNGTTVEGTIVQEINGDIFFKYTENGVEKRQRFTSDQIAKIERNVDATPAAPAAAPESPKATPAPEAPAPAGVPAAAAAVAKAVTPAPTTGSKVPKAAVITLGDRTYGEYVGVYFTAHALREALPGLRQELGTDGSGVIVFRIYSGGGLGLEIDKMWDVIRNEYMKHFRCVAWIESAISAAAMTAHCMEEIYFTSQANYGACTGWSGDLVAVKGADRQEYLTKMEHISRMAGHDIAIMESMQIQTPLSATINPDGTVSLFKDAVSGDFVVNRVGEILTLTADMAEKIKFSKGTADTLKDLEKLMGYQELDWVGDDVKGVEWPICKAERTNIEFRKKTKYDEDRTNEYFRRYQTEVAFAENVERAERPKFVGKARQTLEQFKSMMRNNPNFNITVFNSESPQVFKDWLARQEQLLKDLLR